MADTSKQKLDRLAMKCWMDSRKTGIGYSVYILSAVIESFRMIQRQWAANQLMYRVVMLEHYGVEGV